MRDFYQKMKRSEMIIGLVFVVLGLVFLIWPGLSMQVACRGIGILMLAYGLVQLVNYLWNQERDLIAHGMFMFGLVIGVIGAWIAIQPELVIAALPVIAGIIITLHGIQNVMQAFALKKQGYPKWQLAAVFGVVTLMLGILLVANPFTAAEMLVRFIGLFLICDGASNIWIQSRISADF